MEAHVYNFKVNNDMFTSGQTVSVNGHKYSIHSNSKRSFGLNMLIREVFWFKFSNHIVHTAQHTFKISNSIINK